MFTISRDNLFNILCFHNGLIRMRFVADLITSCNGITHTFYNHEFTKSGTDLVPYSLKQSAMMKRAMRMKTKNCEDVKVINTTERQEQDDSDSNRSTDRMGKRESDQVESRNRVESVALESTSSGIALVDSRSVGASVCHDSRDRVESFMDKNSDRRISDPALVDNPEADPEAETMKVRDDAFYESYTSLHGLARRILADIVSTIASTEDKGGGLRGLRRISSVASINVDSSSGSERDDIDESDYDDDSD